MLYFIKCIPYSPSSQTLPTTSSPNFMTFVLAHRVQGMLLYAHGCGAIYWGMTLSNTVSLNPQKLLTAESSARSRVSWAPPHWKFGQLIVCQWAWLRWVPECSPSAICRRCCLIKEEGRQRKLHCNPQRDVCLLGIKTMLYLNGLCLSYFLLVW